MVTTLEQVEAQRRIASAGRLPPIHNSASSNPGAADPPDAGRPRGPDDGSSKVGPAREATVCHHHRAGVCDAGVRDLVEQVARRRMTLVTQELRLLAAQVRTYAPGRWPLVAVQAFVRDCDEHLSVIRKRVADAINDYPPVVLGRLPDELTAKS
jgi:hypothetical protein